jgi:hypothetical protein
MLVSTVQSKMIDSKCAKLEAATRVGVIFQAAVEEMP